MKPNLISTAMGLGDPVEDMKNEELDRKRKLLQGGRMQPVGNISQLLGYSEPALGRGY